MTELYETLTASKDPIGSHDEVYSLAELHAKSTHVIEISDGLLAVLERPDNIMVSFVVLRFSSGPVVGESPSETALYKHVFHGMGFAGSLRELRHTYWGEPDNCGYIFYPSAATIGDAFKELERWFDT